MIKLIAFFSAVLLAFSASATSTSTSKNVDIIVTHGAALTTFTFVNNSGSTLPAGTPVTMGQGFRYGDIMPGKYPVIRDATTHAPLAGQQWDEISTWRENNGNGSWRHAAWAIWLPNSLAPGATYTVEFVPAAGTYSESSHQALAALCSGPARHDLKIHLTDVRNQDDTVRDSGDATFRLCDNIANVGRDAPRHLRAGNVYDEYEVKGVFTYTSGNKEPLLYPTCIVDLFTKAADGTSLGDVRWVCEVHNPWMNVAAGTAGNAGAPGPVGFTGDPQALVYRIEVDDGSTDVLDWSRLDQTVASANNPIQTSGCGDASDGTTCVSIPGSIVNSPTGYYTGQAVRVSCTGTCAGGLTNGHVYFVYPASMIGTRGIDDTKIVLTVHPDMVYEFGPQYNALRNTQGTGTTTFSDRMYHPHWQTLLTLDTSGDENWSPAGSATRTTRRIYPAFTAAEKAYWQQTGLVAPVNLSQQPVLGPLYSQGGDPNYNPFGRLNVYGGNGTGPRADIGLFNDYANTAFITEAQSDWMAARLFSLAQPSHAWAVMLNEATGRIPALNNGPPTGPGGNGVGSSYPELGAPWPNANWYGYPTFTGTNIIEPRTTAMYGGPGAWITGVWGNLDADVSHMPQFGGISYQVFGSRHFLDLQYYQGNKSYLGVQPGNFDGGRDNTLAGNHYFGLILSCSICEGPRGAAWGLRDRVFPAALGGDNNVERTYYNDHVTEFSNYYPLWLSWKDGPGNSNFTNSIFPPLDPGSGNNAQSIFMEGYVASVGYILQTHLHSPLSQIFGAKEAKVVQSTLGRQAPGALSPFYSIMYYTSNAVHDGGQSFCGGNVGPGTNGADATDYGSWASNSTVQANGVIYNADNTYANGDLVKDVSGAFTCGSQHGLDQLQPYTQWFQLTNVNNTTHTFQIVNPATGQPFTSYTAGGTPVAVGTSNLNLIYRPTSDPGGFADWNYAMDMGSILAYLNILGYNVSNAQANFDARNGSSGYSDSRPGYHLDPTVVVPR